MKRAGAAMLASRRRVAVGGFVGVRQVAFPDKVNRILETFHGTRKDEQECENCGDAAKPRHL